MSTVTPPWRVATPHSNTGVPAYTAVKARRNLTQPHSSSSAQAASTSAPQPNNPSSDSRKKVEWPPAVREYVQRTFYPENQIPGVARTEMEAKLKHMITEAAGNDTLTTIDWCALPLPQELIRNERNQPVPSTTSPGAPNGFSSGIQSLALSPKRKSPDISTTGDDDDASNLPPWRKANNRNNFEDRISYPALADKRRRIEEAGMKESSKFSRTALETRKRRFESSGISSYTSTAVDRRDTMPDVGPVIGRSTKLEKRYLRLTTAPNPDEVRPLHVLRKTLDHLKKKWKQENNYGYVCDQFKSMRQDLTVQHIKNEFTVNVYEIHARIALEKGDLGEYNQCQTQLQALYALKLGGHPMEFKAYRILYFIYTRNRTAINGSLADLTPAEKADPAVKHALDVRSALALGNYHRFFQLYLDTPNMGAYLMDMFVDRERLAALACICKAYKPEVNIRFITEELGFESDEQSARFILDHVAEHLLQEKADGVKLLTGKCGSVFEQATAAANKLIDIKGQI
ncbi:hypothetical protein FQN57_006544 [Myotisia sp. PD_48]|nr:hypothetical protein FQN57_006544 [Myotisia sp. PD_48]